MNKSDIKHVIKNLEPDKEMEYRLSEKIIKNQHNKFVFKPIISIAASLIIVICIGIVGFHILEKKPNPSATIKNSNAGIYISKIELPKDINIAADMIGLIVYQQRIYTQTGTTVSTKAAENLLDEKLGTTKTGLDEWSQQQDYAVEFASTIGKTDVYSVKGYDKNFRIMTYEEIDGTIYPQFFECINGITVKSGADIFDKLKIDNNIKTAKYENFESWNYNKKQYHGLTELQVLNGFVKELKNTMPFTQQSLSYLFDDKPEVNQKFVYITLVDGSEVQLRLFIDGYVYYSSSHIFFKMENQAFHQFWNELK